MICGEVGELSPGLLGGKGGINQTYRNASRVVGRMNDDPFVT